jgi:NitT/TauT family transport system ATP-binding protein
MVHAPGLLLLDEPFAHLDELTRDELGTELVQLWTASRPTVLMVTHSPSEAVSLAQRVVVLSPAPGRVVGEVMSDRTWPAPGDDGRTFAALAEARRLLAVGHNPP